MAFIVYASFKLVNYKSSQKAKQVEQGMNQYLNKKYGMEFEFIKKPYTNGNEGFGYLYQAKVIPVGKPELEFLVQEKKADTGVYIDGYLQTKWTYEGKQEIDKKIKEVYGSETDFVLKYEFRYNNEKYKDLSHAEVLAKDNVKPYIYIYIHYDIFSDEKFDKYKEVEKAYKILKPYLIDNKIDVYDFDVIVYSTKYKQEYVSNGNNSGTKSFDTLHKEGSLINWLRVDNSEGFHPIEANRSDDLVKWYQY